MKEEQESSGVGRPTKYRDAYCDQAKDLCLLGATDKMLADFFEVNEDTIHEWKKAHPEFYDSIKAGKMLADSKVAAALFKRATGFTYEETTFEKIVTDDAVDDNIAVNLYKKKVVVKTLAPDTGAAMNWLKNRQKELWRDNIDIDFNKLSDEQLDRIIANLTNKANNNL
jgi:hypothetical protein